MAMILSVNHSPLSADEEHSGSDTILKTLGKAFRQSHLLPDIILSGHDHNYQRFMRDLDVGRKNTKFHIL
jgi:acid phosphatase type 7